MKIEAWLKINGRTRTWLAREIGVSCPMITKGLKRETGTLPYSWIPAILRITNGEVSIDDEWIKQETRETRKNPSREEGSACAATD